MEDGGWRMEDGGWRMEEDGGWRMEGGGWRMEDGRGKVEEGGRWEWRGRVEGKNSHSLKRKEELKKTCKGCILTFTSKSTSVCRAGLISTDTENKGGAGVSSETTPAELSEFFSVPGKNEKKKKTWKKS
jgi:hypothetical protein